MFPYILSYLTYYIGYQKSSSLLQFEQLSYPAEIKDIRCIIMAFIAGKWCNNLHV